MTVSEGEEMYTERGPRCPTNNNRASPRRLKNYACYF